MDTTPLVSVIMPSYNSELFIEEAIQSIIAQTYSNWELIIIDDCSKDSTQNIINSAAEKYSNIIVVINDHNCGAGISRNKGIAVANGSYIAFLDADDRWLPQKLQLQLDFLHKHDLSMTFSSFYLLNENGEFRNEQISALPVLSYKKLLRSNYVGNLTGIYSVEKLGKIYGPEIRKRQDWGLWLKILKKIGSTQALTQPLAEYRIRKNSMSSNKTEMLKWNYKVYREVLGFSTLKSYWYMMQFLAEHFLVKNKQRVSTD